MDCEFQAADLYEALQKTFPKLRTIGNFFYKKKQELYTVIFNDYISAWQFTTRSIQSDFSPKIESLKAVIDSYWYYTIQLNYSSWEIRKLKGLLFSIFSDPGFKTPFLNAYDW